MGLWTEKMYEIRHRAMRAIMGLSRGVFIQWKRPSHVFVIMKAVSAMRVRMWITVMAHGWTEALARGAKIKRA